VRASTIINYHWPFGKGLTLKSELTSE